MRRIIQLWNAARRSGTSFQNVQKARYRNPKTKSYWFSSCLDLPKSCSRMFKRPTKRETPLLSVPVSTFDQVKIWKIKVVIIVFFYKKILYLLIENSFEIEYNFIILLNLSNRPIINNY